MTAPASVLIVGAGQAGLQIAVSLRHEGFDGRITIVGEEARGPYQRPPLSKAYLFGESTEEDLEFRNDDFYSENRIVLHTSEEVVDVTFGGDGGVATTSTGRSIPFERLAFATGAVPRRLDIEGGNMEGVTYLRTLDDARDLRERWVAAQDVVVVGGGFIGLEVAAAARKAGKTVTVLEAADRLIARAVSPVTSDFYRAAHERRGTRIRLRARLARFVGAEGHVTGVEMEDGEVIPATIIAVGIGVVPRSELAQSLGIEVDRGAIVVDEYARTSDSRVVAAGDVTTMPDPVNGAASIRLESVQNAVDQAKIAAASILGKSTRYSAVPWFWSDQADVKLQIAGLSSVHDHTVVRGDIESEKFTLLYYHHGRLVAADSVNSSVDFMTVRKTLAARGSIDADRAGDSTIPLKELVC